MQELRLEVVIDPKLPKFVPGAVALGDFEPDKAMAVYREGDLSGFFADLIMGRPFPLKLVVRDIHSLGTLVSIVLFLRRDVALQPAAASLVTAVNMFERWGVAGLAHVEPDLARGLLLLSNFVPSGLSRKDQEDRLALAINWIADYVLKGDLPVMPPEPEPPRVIDQGTDGFVLAEGAEGVPLEYGWIILFRQGFLRGALFSPPKNDRRLVLVAKKSLWLNLDLHRAGEIFNEAEKAMGEYPGWNADGLWLRGPQQGTLLLISAMTKVLVLV
jgi:hypothetical protein